ncbi:hypothetical protein [Variovorax paradoxus]|uniref:hypothetical protein n=1 Tax=Variovorax paradoxus TaxID=34073 RepID=UPI0012D3D84C|nr:hypothetical protein [Variovorax paradoxus]
MTITLFDQIKSYLEKILAIPTELARAGQAQMFRRGALSCSPIYASTESMITAIRIVKGRIFGSGD